MDALLDRLNPEQRNAVTAAPGPLLILAGAGSGKTRVLTHRVAWLLRDRGARPETIVGVTFTNKAAEEMRQRLAVLVGPGSGALNLHTFHALGARLLRRHGAAVGLPPGFGILDDDDSLALCREAVRTAGGDGSLPAAELHAF
ncbi:MAG: ATP-dependent helicase, partial [bacterium]